MTALRGFLDPELPWWQNDAAACQERSHANLAQPMDFSVARSGAA
jgi:hypothetical protein